MFTKIVQHKKLVILIAAALFLVAASALAYEEYLDWQEDRADRAAVQQLVAAMDIPQEAGFHAVADYVRNYVWEHSVYNMDEEFFSYWGDEPHIIGMMLAYARGETDKRPHMECSSRGGLVQNVLAALGYRVRSVDIYLHARNYPAHSFLEVLNPETQRWEIHDADFNIFWRDTQTGARAGIVDMMAAADLNRFVPCLSPDHCGWHVETKPGKRIASMKERYGLAVVIDRVADERPLFVNKDRFAWEEPVEVEGRGELLYCDYMDKNCRGPISFF